MSVLAWFIVLHLTRGSWTEPILLCLIIFHAVVLTIQASFSLTLENSTDQPPEIQGYFHQWEDYALFALFILFT